MNDFLYGGFQYDGLDNLGDYIQSISSEMYLPRVDKRFNRDALINGSTDRYLIIMNGWFSHKPHLFPPSDSILPVFWGFHVTNWNNSWEYFLSDRCVNYLKTHEPIGCRDMYTMEKLRAAGIRAFYSKCLTLTFPKRKREPVDGWNILVDVPVLLPSFIEDNAIHVSQEISPDISEEMKMKQAAKLLHLYETNAKLIITTRLHCALPAIAMGIPVIFLGNPEDYRVSIIKDVGVKIYDYPRDIVWTSREEIVERLNEFWKGIDWTPEPVDFEEEKKSLVLHFREHFNNRIMLIDR